MEYEDRPGSRVRAAMQQLAADHPTMRDHAALKTTLDAVHELENALRNVRALAMRIRRTDPVNGDHLIRFCREVGIEASITRETNDE